MSGGTACTFLALALDGGERSTSCLCCFIPGKKVWYPLKRRLGRPHSRPSPFGEQKISHPHQDLNSESSSPQPSHCADHAIVDAAQDLRQFEIITYLLQYTSFSFSFPLLYRNKNLCSAP